MILTLKNVRCHADCVINLGEKGITLIQGSSGKGKTTLFVAINFCLFGDGNKVLNDKNGFVQLDFVFNNKKYKCVRTKKTRITVYINDDTVYEDDPAQAIINEIFTEKFDVAGYIQQNMIKSFIVMSPTEKLEFLEKFAFNGANVIEIKERMRLEIKHRNEKLIKITTELETYKKMFNEMYKNPESVPKEVPFIVGKEVLPENREHKEFLIRKKVAKFEKEETKINSAITECQNEINSIKMLNSVIIEKERFLFNLKEKLNNLKKSLIDIEVDENKLEQDEQLLKLLISQRESEFMQNRILEDRKRLEDMKENEINEHNEKVNSIKDILWKDYSKKECDEILNENTELLNEVNEIKRIQNEIEKLGLTKTNYTEENLENKKEQLRQTRLALQSIGVYKCPKCSCSLKLNSSNCLILHELEISNVKSNKAQLENDIKKLEKEIEIIQIALNKEAENKSKISLLQIELSKYDLSYLEQYDTIVENIEEIKKYKNTHINLEKELEKIQKFQFSTNCINFENKIVSMEKRIVKSVKIDVDEEVLRFEIAQQKEFKNNKNRIEKEIQMASLEINKLTNEICSIKEEHISSFTEIRNVKECEKLLQDLEIEQKENNESLILYKRYVEDIEKYKINQMSLNKYEELQNNIINLEIEEERCREQYSAVNEFKNIMQEAESIAILNIIDSINSHAQIYLDLFFPVDPISVRLTPFKETKERTKSVINVQIDYKNMESDISMLSGGELSRVVLAYTLALNEIFNIPILLLDESIASLDQELSITVIDAIKEHIPTKLVLLIAHQIVNGICDNVVNL